MKKNRPIPPSPAPEVKRRPSFLSSPGFWVKVFIAVQMALLAAEFSPDISTNGDDAKYLILGKSLVSGTGYRYIYQPDRPVESQYPPLFPAFLGITGAGSHSPLVPKLAVGILSGLMLLLLYSYLRRTPLAGLAMPLVIFTALSSSVASHSTLLLSEVPYLFATLAALLLYELYRNRNTPGVLFWAAALVAVTPAFTRTVGISFVGAWVIAAVLDKKYKQAAAHTLLFVALMFLLRLTTAWNSPYIDQLFRRNSYNPELGFVTPAEMVERIGANIHQYFLGVFPPALLGNSASGGLANAFYFLVMVLALVGWARNFRLPTRILSLYLLFYSAIISMWQTQWTSQRFIIPIVPFVILFAFLGMQTLSDLAFRLAGKKGVSPTFRAVPLWALLFVLAACNFGDRINGLTTDKRPTPDWNNFYSCADWVSRNTPPDAIVVNRKPELFYLRSQRRGFVYPFSSDPQKVIDGLKKGGATYCVLDGFLWTGTTMRYLVPAIRKRPDLFKVVYSLQNPETYVLEMNFQ